MSILSDIIYWVLIVFMSCVLFLLAVAGVWTAYVHMVARREDAEMRRQLEEHERPWDWEVDGGPVDEKYPLSGVHMIDKVPEEWVREWQR